MKPQRDNKGLFLQCCKIGQEVVNLVGAQHEFRHLHVAAMTDTNAFRKRFGKIFYRVAFGEHPEGYRGSVRAFTRLVDRVANGAIYLRKGPPACGTSSIFFSPRALPSILAGGQAANEKRGKKLPK